MVNATPYISTHGSYGVGKDGDWKVITHDNASFSCSPEIVRRTRINLYTFIFTKYLWRVCPKQKYGYSWFEEGESLCCRIARNTTIQLVSWGLNAVFGARNGSELWTHAQWCTDDTCPLAVNLKLHSNYFAEDSSLTLNTNILWHFHGLIYIYINISMCLYVLSLIVECQGWRAEAFYG